MKVLLLSTSNSRNAGGLFPAIKYLGQLLFKMDGVQPVVLAFRDEYSDEDIPTYYPLPIEEYHIKGSPGIALTFDLSDQMKKISPDIIHMNGIWLFTSYINQKYAHKYKVPYIVSPHGMLDKWILNTRPWKKKLGLALYETKHLKRAACIQALSTTEYKSIREFGLKNPVAIIPNGVFLPEADKSDIAELPAWKKDDDRKVILFLSRIHPKKGLDNLINAWAGINHYKNEWKLVIAGEGSTEYYNSLIQLKDNLNLQNDVFFIGNQSGKNKENCFLNADVFILPTFSEGMPVAVLEAWSYKLPTLITDGCNLPEGFAMDAAIKIGTGTEDILNGLNNLFITPKQELDKIGANALQLVKDKFTWGAISRQYFDVYNWVLNGGTVPDSVKLD